MCTSNHYGVIMANLKISELLNNPNLQYILGLFSDLEYNSSGLFEDFSKSYYSTAKPKAKGIFENYELIFHGTSVYVRFFFEYKGIKVYYKDAIPYLLGTNHQGKKIKNFEDSEKLQKLLVKEGYSLTVIEKALKEARSLAIDTPPIEKLLKGLDFTYYEAGKSLIINTNEVGLKLLNDVAQVLKVDVEKMQVEARANDDGESYIELEWK